MDKEHLMKTIAHNLRRYRRENDLTQEELAERAGISTSFCANIERGSKSMSIFVLCDLANALGITADDLLYDNNKPGDNQHIKNISALLNGRSEMTYKLAEQVLRFTIKTYDETQNSFSGVGDEIN